ncbi:MAG: hypothetical protein NUV35_07585, partial [Syntrophomonadaceae bacterium]|nr:hypothetical protein [Syntrophomonadaceae bacterium]
MSDMVKAFYRDILTQVLAVETRKKRASERLLLTRAERPRLRIIREFLTLDLDKHNLLEQAAIAAFRNDEKEVLEHLRQLYGLDDDSRLIDAIREEIARTERLLLPVVNEIKYPRTSGFSERRLLQEVQKYAVARAREYVK